MHDPDRDFILDSIQHGFKLIPESDTSCIASYDSDNYASVTCAEFKPEMDELFPKGVSLGRISRVANKPQCIHPIGRVPKKESEKSRQVTDCSRPHGFSLNDYIKRDLESFRMNSIDTALSFSSSSCVYAIVEIESTWRWVPVFLLIVSCRDFARCLENMIKVTSISWIIASVLEFSVLPSFSIAIIMPLLA